MKKLQQFFIFSIFLFAFQLNSFAQETPEDSTKVSWDWYHVVKHNGVEYIAQIISDDGREVLIYTKELGKIYIPKSEIKSMKKIDDPKDVKFGEFRGVGPFSTRYFFTTNALPIMKGENYALINLYGPEVHFAVSNSTSVGFMSTWIVSPIALAVKQTFKTRNPLLNFSLGTINGSSGYLNSFRGYGGMTFGNVTYGTRSSNITFASGFGYIRSGNRNFMKQGYSEYSYGYSPYYLYGNEKNPARYGSLFSLSGITQVGAKASFIIDVIYAHGTYVEQTVTSSGIVSDAYTDANGNYVPATYFQNVANVKFHRDYLILMPGMRFQKSDREAFQFALAGVTVFNSGDVFTFPIPMCSWFYKF